MHLLIRPDGNRTPLPAPFRTTSVPADQIEERIGDLLDGIDPATARLVGQRLRGERDPWTGHASGRLVRQLGLGGEDPDTERGHFVWWPRGVRVRRALAEWLRRFHEDELGAEPITTPVPRTWEVGDHLFDLAGGYDARLYGIELDGDRRGILTYGGDPGFLSLLGRADPPKGGRPWRVHEHVTAYRRSRRSELGGLQRTRSFEFFDLHSVVPRADGMTEYLEVLGRQVGFVRRHGHGAAIEVRAATDDVAAVEALTRFACDTGRAVLVWLVDGSQKYYRLLHNLFDDRGLHTMHGQLDETNAARWRGHSDPSLCIVHAASGTVERWLLVHLLDAGDRPAPALPTWLTPFHLTLVPVTSGHRQRAAEVGDDLAARGVRVRIDDRDLSVGRRIRNSIEVWVPRTVVLGDRDPAATREITIRSADGELLSHRLGEIAHELTSTGPDGLWPVLPPSWVTDEPRWG